MPTRIAVPEVKLVRSLLPALPAEAAEEAASSARIMTYSPGETIMSNRQGWAPAIVADGTVRMTIRSHDGRAAVLRLITRGSMIGLIGVFAGDPAAPTAERLLVAETAATVVVLDAAVVIRLALLHSKFGIDLVQSLAHIASELTDAAGRYAFLTVRERVAAHLLRVAGSGGRAGAVTVAMTQQQLADAVGSVREVVARTLSELRSEGIINPGRASIQIVDKRRLAEIASVT